MRANANAKLRSLKLKIVELETEVQRTKAAYNEALQNLEKISDEIHKLREDQKLLNAFPDEQNKAQSNKNKTYLCYQNSLSDDYELVDEDDDENKNETKPNGEQDDQQKLTDVWSDIPLNSGAMTASNSTTSSYSQTSDREDKLKNDETESKETSNKDDDKKSGSFSFFRRQSLEDVFAQSTLFGKFGRSLERRNSESEVETSSSFSSTKKDFFLFSTKTEGLTNSQIESLFLPDEHL
ncbi:hypothetical protein PVAND_004255 [Polypedilum vanderplanki]|uniref:Uncharacterized protein n=1 Tax=Polypedilum vanderplanki TaxID=319348 RepID=A0A9J6BXK0_POLVA|nr:hypothetical protein PVAND_004255 [Polypedilum vanderplanki]